MSEVRINSLIFDQGIVSITHADREEATGMPERSDAPPPDVGARAQLDMLLQKPSMDSRLGFFLRPDIENRDLLAPARFSAALGRVLENLRQAAKKEADASPRSRVLNRAVRLLNDESDLRGLVQMYRSALYQG